jgi:hypothetical protein
MLLVFKRKSSLNKKISVYALFEKSSKSFPQLIMDSSTCYSVCVSKIEIPLPTQREEIGFTCERGQHVWKQRQPSKSLAKGQLVPIFSS